MMQQSKISVAISVLLVTLAMAQIAFNLKPWSSAFRPLDFSLYHQAVTYWQAGGDPYGLLPGALSGMQFLYPPGALLLLWPLTLVSFPTAVMVWWALSVGCVFVMTWCVLGMGENWLRKTDLAAKVNQLKGKTPRYDWWLLVTAMCLQTFPLKLTLGLGQANLIVAALLVLAVTLGEERVEKRTGERIGNQAEKLSERNSSWRWLLVGFCLALSVSFKPIGLVVLWWWLWQRKFTPVGWSLGFMILLNGWNLDLMRHFWEITWSLLTTPMGQPDAAQQSLAALFFRLTANPLLSPRLAWVLWGVLLAPTFWQSKKDVATVYGLIAMTTLQFGAGWHHYLVLAYPWILLQPKKWTLIPSWLAMNLHFTSVPVLPLMSAVISLPTLYLIWLRWYETSLIQKDQIR